MSLPSSPPPPSPVAFMLDEVTLEDVVALAVQAHNAAVEARMAQHAAEHTVDHDAGQALTAICQRVEALLHQRGIAAPANLRELVRRRVVE